jgi:Spy/CpxP family protein refolding chaperone
VKKRAYSLFTLAACGGLAVTLVAQAQITPQLVTAAALSSAVISQGPPPGSPGGRPPRFGPPTEEEKERNRIRIGISREQQAQIDKVFRDSDLLMQEIRKRNIDLSRQLYGLYDSYDFDRAQAKTIRRELLTLHKRMTDIHAENEEKLRHIMNREQFERMRAIVREDWENRRKQWERQRANGGARP